jgi:hypothetical protein
MELGTRGWSRSGRGPGADAVFRHISTLYLFIQEMLSHAIIL